MSYKSIMDQDQNRLEAGLLSNDWQNEKTLLAEESSGSTTGIDDKSDSSPYKGRLSLWKLAIIILGTYSVVYIVGSKFLLSTGKPCMHHTFGFGRNNENGLTTQDELEQDIVGQALVEATVPAVNLVKKRADSVDTSTPTAPSKNDNTVSDSPTTQASSNAATGTASNAPTSTANPTSQQPTSQASSAPATTEQAPTTSQKSTAAQPTTTNQPTKDSTTNQASTQVSTQASTQQGTTSQASQPTSTKGSDSTSVTDSQKETSTNSPAPSSTEPADTTVDAPTSTSDGKHTSKGKATSSPVPHTLTQTLQDGQVTVMTSTSWVDVTPASGTPDSSNNPDLQNTGVKSLVSTLAVLGAAFMGGMLLV